MRMEAKAIAAALGHPRHDGLSPLSMEMGGAAVDLHTIGIRGVRLPLPSLAESSILILAGLGGAIDPSLRIGDVVVHAPAGLVPDELPWRRGPICSAHQLISTPADKAGLFATTGALAVDMESDVVRKAAAEQDVPCIAIRTISDTADEAIDPAVMSFVDDLGRPRLGAVASGLLRRPGLLRDLSHLAKNSKLASQRLGEAVRQLLSDEQFIHRCLSVFDAGTGNAS